MIRLRDLFTGAEAEWDGGDWSGDPGFIERLRVLTDIEHVYSSAVHDSFASVQQRMAERLPRHGIDVVRQAEPEELPLPEGFEIP